MFSGSEGLPSIRLVSAQTSVPPRSTEPTDLRWLRVEEYFQARSLAENTQKVYRRELKRFLAWSDRSFAPEHHSSTTNFLSVDCSIDKKIYLYSCLYKFQPTRNQGTTI